MKKTLEYAVLCIVAVVMAVTVLEWFAGCGETYVDSIGRRHFYECTFINLPRR